MDLRDELIGLAYDNCASAQPFPRFGISPVFPKPGKGERPSVFHGNRERQLRFSCFAPSVESIRRNQAAPLFEKRTCLFREHSAPEPLANQNGRQPKDEGKRSHQDRSQSRRAPSGAASISGLPFSYSALANLTMRMAFLAAKPMSMIRPICA